MHPLFPLGLKLVELVVDQKKTKRERREAVKDAAVDVVSAVSNSKVTTAVAVAPAAAAMYDYTPLLPDNLQPYALVINSLFCLISALLVTYQNAEKTKK